MCKKLGMTALVVVGALVALSWVGLLPYVSMWVKSTPDRVKQSVPPEAKIERLKAEIQNIDPDMRRQLNAIATEQVEVEKLRRQITVAKTNLKEREESLRTMHTKFEAGETFVTTGGKAVPREKIKAQLASQFDSFEQAEASLKSQESLLEAREENLARANERLAQMKQKKRDLEVAVKQLEAELTRLRLDQTANNLTVDDSQVSEAEKLLQEIKDQIAKDRILLDLKKAEVSDEAAADAIENEVRADKAFKKMKDRFTDTKVADKK